MKVLAAEKPPHMTELDFEVRLEVLTRNLPPQLEAHAQLKQKLAAMREELTERRALIARREERDLARAIEKAKGDAGPESAKRQRVENSMDRQRRGSLKELRALQKTRPERDDDPDSTPDEPDPGTDSDTAPAAPAPAPAPAPNHEDSEPTESAVSTVTNGNPDTTGSVEMAETPVAPVNTPATDSTEASDTPQKCGDEPTCQNGSREADVAIDTAGRLGFFPTPEDVARLLLTRPAEAPDDAPALTRPSATLCQGEDDLGPDVPADAELAAIHREIETIREAWRMRDKERKERQERQDREMREQREEQARRIDAHFGIKGDRPESAPAGHDPVPGGQAGRPPPSPEGGTV
jgi:hypothetical protein